MITSEHIPNVVQCTTYLPPPCMVRKFLISWFEIGFIFILVEKEDSIQYEKTLESLKMA